MIAIANKPTRQEESVFFECIEGHDYATNLFQAAETYLQKRGIELVDATIDFGSRDCYWVLLVDGFEPPLFQENYHPLKSTYSAKGISIGIHPDYQAQGIVALPIDFLCSERNLKRYPNIYLAGISTQNHQIRSIYEKLNLKIARIHSTYRKALNPDIDLAPLESIEEVISVG